MEQIDIVWDSVVDFYTKYLDLDGPNSSFVFQLLYLNHSFIVANMTFNLFKQNPRKDANGETQFPLVAGVLMMLVTGLGGAIINAVLLGEQQVFLSQDILLAYFLLAWALTIYSPFYVVHYITGNVIVELFSYAVEGYFVAQFLMNGVNKGVLLFPGKNVAPIVIGTLSAIGGGGILKPFFANLYFGRPMLSSELSSPTFTGFVALTSACGYLLGHHYGLAGNYVVQLSSKVTLTFTPQWVVRTVYILFFLFLWFRVSFLPLFSSSSTPAKKKVDSPEFPSVGNKRIESHEKKVVDAKFDQSIASKPTSPNKGARSGKKGKKQN